MKKLFNLFRYCCFAAIIVRPFLNNMQIIHYIENITAIFEFLMWAGILIMIIGGICYSNCDYNSANADPWFKSANEFLEAQKYGIVRKYLKVILYISAILVSAVIIGDFSMSAALILFYFFEKAAKMQAEKLIARFKAKQKEVI